MVRNILSKMIFENLLLIEKILSFISDKKDVGNFLSLNKKIYNYFYKRWYVKNKYFDKFRKNYDVIISSRKYIGATNMEENGKEFKMGVAFRQEITDGTKVCFFGKNDNIPTFLNIFGPRFLKYGIGISEDGEYKSNKTLNKFLPEAFIFSSLEIQQCFEKIKFGERSIFKNPKNRLGSFVIVSDYDLPNNVSEKISVLDKFASIKFEDSKLLWLHTTNEKISPYRLKSFDILVFDSMDRMVKQLGLKRYYHPQVFCKYFYVISMKYKKFMLLEIDQFIPDFNKQHHEFFQTKRSKKTSEALKIGCSKFKNNDPLFVYEQFHSKNLKKFKYNVPNKFIKYLQRSAFTHL
jgi:hypothetical protein